MARRAPGVSEALPARIWAAASANLHLAAPVRRYLAGRGAWPPDRALPPAVRWLPRDAAARLDESLAAGPDARRVVRLPRDAAGTVVYAFARVSTGDLQAVQIDALTVEGSYPATRWRRTCGSSKHAVFPALAPKDDPGEALHIAEGPVDALAIATWRARAAWAAGGTSGLAALAPALAATGREIVIEADDDGPGRQAAEALQDALHHAGAVARLHYWPGCDPAEGLAAEWAERAAILEFDPALPRAEAEALAWKKASR